MCALLLLSNQKGNTYKSVFARVSNKKMKHVTAFYNTISRSYGLNESLERGFMNNTFSFSASSNLEAECNRFLDERSIRTKRRKFILTLAYNNEMQLERLVELGNAMVRIYLKATVEKSGPD